MPSTDLRAWHGRSGRTCRIGQIARKMNPRGYHDVTTRTFLRRPFNIIFVALFEILSSRRYSLRREAPARHESIKENCINVSYRRRFRFIECNGRLGRRKCLNGLTSRNTTILPRARTCVCALVGQQFFVALRFFTMNENRRVRGIRGNRNKLWKPVMASTDLAHARLYALSISYGK